MAEQTVLGTEDSGRPYYPASWVDCLTNWVNGLPVAPWVFYLCLWLLLFILESGSKWLDGSQPFGELRWIYAFYSFYGIYFLGTIHYLDNWTKTAFRNFRPALAVSEAEQTLLLYQLTTMPARTVWIVSAATLLGVIVLLRPLITPLWQSVGIYHNSATATFVELGLFSFNALILAVFTTHTLRQLRWVGRIHSIAAGVNLFQLRPLYSLSGLTARTAGTLLLVGYLVTLNNRLVLRENFAPDPGVRWVSWLFPLISILFFSLLGAAVFFLPLLGLHQLLLREKERLQTEADSLLQAHIQELHRRVDARQLEDADAINHHLTSLALERDILARLPTWPWQPGTLNAIITALLLPIILWIMQQLLGRWVGF